MGKLVKKDSINMPKAVVKASNLGTKGNNAKAPKGSTESLKSKKPKRKA